MLQSANTMILHIYLLPRDINLEDNIDNINDLYLLFDGEVSPLRYDTAVLEPE